MSEDVEMTFHPVDALLHPPSYACLRYMTAHDFDPEMPVFRAVLSPQAMLQVKAWRPDVANIVSLLVGPFGIVDARPGNPVIRVAELQVGDIVLDVEAEYVDEPPEGWPED